MRFSRGVRPTRHTTNSPQVERTQLATYKMSTRHKLFKLATQNVSNAYLQSLTEDMRKSNLCVQTNSNLPKQIKNLFKQITICSNKLVIYSSILLICSNKLLLVQTNGLFICSNILLFGDTCRTVCAIALHRKTKTNPNPNLDSD